MIYVLKSAGLNEKDEFELLIKIGFTSDIEEKSTKRFDMYKLHNPTYKILYKVNKCSEKTEHLLHQYFEKHRRYGQEWYEYSKDILDFF